MIDAEALVRDMFANMFEAPERYFGPQSRYYMWGLEHPPLVGPQAMKQGMAEIVGCLSDLDFEFVAFAASGRKVFCERIDRFTAAGRRISLPIVGVGELGEDGKFVSWVEYFDLTPFANVGLFPSETGGVKRR